MTMKLLNELIKTYFQYIRIMISFEIYYQFSDFIDRIYLPTGDTIIEIPQVAE